jgi:hypothetical protein
VVCFGVFGFGTKYVISGNQAIKRGVVTLVIATTASFQRLFFLVISELLIVLRFGAAAT